MLTLRGATPLKGCPPWTRARICSRHWRDGLTALNRTQQGYCNAAGIRQDTSRSLQALYVEAPKASRKCCLGPLVGLGASEYVVARASAQVYSAGSAAHRSQGRSSVVTRTGVTCFAHHTCTWTGDVGVHEMVCWPA